MNENNKLNPYEIEIQNIIDIRNCRINVLMSLYWI